MVSGETIFTGIKKGFELIKAFFVPRTGFEPAHLAAPPPEDGASTNFATWASLLGLQI
jgi:hypothetical protein